MYCLSFIIHCPKNWATSIFALHVKCCQTAACVKSAHIYVSTSMIP